jgi:LmbE family N-acetylglucosaminyl deacetylase
MSRLIRGVDKPTICGLFGRLLASKDPGMKMQNVLVVAAHPDDEVLGVGGTIPLIKQQGGRVSVVIVTDGSSTQYAGRRDVEIQKQQHALEANKILGTDEVIQWDFPDMRLDTVEHNKLNSAETGDRRRPTAPHAALPAVAVVRRRHDRSRRVRAEIGQGQLLDR